MKAQGIDAQFAELSQKVDQALFEKLKQQYSGNIKQLTQISEIAKTHIRPQFEHRAYLFKDGVRENRGFEVEYRRILLRVLGFYLSKSVPPEKLCLSETEKADYRELLVKLIAPVVDKAIFPMFDGLPDIGEDIYLLIYYWIIAGDVSQTIENILESGETPPEMGEGVFGMLALLKNAREAADAQSMSLAYSYLLDVNHLIGMRDGAVYASKHLPVVTRKRQAKAGKKAQTDVYAACRKRIAELYVTMLREDELSRVTRKANFYGKRIWQILYDEAKRSGTTSGWLQQSGVITECRKLAKQQKKNAGPRSASAK